MDDSFFVSYDGVTCCSKCSEDYSLIEKLPLPEGFLWCLICSKCGYTKPMEKK